MKNIKSILLAFFIITVTSSISSAQTTDNVKTISVKVKGINCEEDVKTISANIAKLNGVNSCTAGTPSATTSFQVKYNAAVVTEKDIYAAVENTGGCENPEEKPYKVKK